MKKLLLAIVIMGLLLLSACTERSIASVPPIVSVEEFSIALKNPKEYTGVNCEKLEGQIYSVEKVGNEKAYLCWADDSHTLAYMFKPASNNAQELSEGTYVYITGEITGTHVYTDAFGVETPLAEIRASLVEISETPIFNKALSSIKADASSEKEGVKVTVDSIDDCERSIRCYITITNNAKTSLAVHGGSSTLEQKYVMFAASPFAYEESNLPDACAPGEKISGCLSYKKIGSFEQVFYLNIEGRLDGKSKPTTFRIKIDPAKLKTK